MYPILILREELVCLVILVFLAFISRTYRMGTDGKIFNRLLLCALVHVFMDGVTVWTVNHMQTVPAWVNYGAHVVFYLSAILYANEIFVYVTNLFHPEATVKWHWLSLIPVGIYILLLPVLGIEFRQVEGTYVSAGGAANAGWVIGFVYFLFAMGMLLRNWHGLSRRIRYSLLPMMLILIAAIITQVVLEEFLFTGGAITIVTVGFFFSLENPAIVLERKMMMDAMTGVENRNSYERDIVEYNREFIANRDKRFIFMFADINNLKSVNGMYGHQAGDEYISLIAVALLNNLKKAEHIYRMGGDEFLAIYRDVDEETVQRDAEKIREECARAGEKKQYKPALAIGYAVSGPNYKDLHDVLKVADYMMYRNKADLKREHAMGASTKRGTELNLTGLTDRIFDAMCMSSSAICPFMVNMETGVTRISPALCDMLGLSDEFYQDFESIITGLIHPDDRKAFREDLRDTLTGRKNRHNCSCRVRKENGEYIPITSCGSVYHGKDGEEDMFFGYIINPEA